LVPSDCEPAEASLYQPVYLWQVLNTVSKTVDWIKVRSAIPQNLSKTDVVKLCWQWKTCIPRVTTIENPVFVTAGVASTPTLNYEEEQFFKNYCNDQLLMELPGFSVG
jgi:hypothetical protein